VEVKERGIVEQGQDRWRWRREVEETTTMDTTTATKIDDDRDKSRVAAGGEIQGVDFTATPYRMGRSLTNRVSTLLQPFLDVETVVQ